MCERTCCCTFCLTLLHFLYVFQEFDPPSEGQAGGQDLLLANLEDSITAGEQVTAPPTESR